MTVIEKTESKDGLNVRTSLRITEKHNWAIVIDEIDTSTGRHLPEKRDEFGGEFSLTRMVEIFKTEY